jgi:hypothetical protein
MANKNFSEMVPVDINDVTFEDELPEGFDPSEDAFETAPPLPDGVYQFKLTLQDENPYESWQDRNGKTQVRANFVGEVVKGVRVHPAYKDETVEGARCFGSVSTTIPRGKRTCTMAGLLRELSQGAGNKAKKLADALGKVKTKDALVKLFDVTIKQEPLLAGSTEWRASEEKDGKAGEDSEWKLIKKGMENFPKLPDGKFNPAVKTKQGEVTAKAKIKRWWGETSLSEAEAHTKAKGVPSTSRPAGTVPKATQTAPEPELEIVEDDEDNG